MRHQSTCRQGHPSHTEASPSSLVQHGGVVDDDLAGRNIHASVLHRCRFCRGEEANYSATSLHCPSDNLRQILMEALHPKLVHADLRLGELANHLMKV